jgi:hypothetical protein
MHSLLGIGNRCLTRRKAAYQSVEIAVASPLRPKQAAEAPQAGLGRYPESPPVDHLFAVGSIEPDRISLNPINDRVRANAWAVAFSGRLNPLARGSELRGEIAPVWAIAKVFMTVWIVGCTLVVLVNAIDLIDGYDASLRKVVHRAGAAAGALVFGLALEALGQWWARRDARALVTWLQDRLRASGA